MAESAGGGVPAGPVGQTRSQMSGFARDVVQARDISGGVHFHHAEQGSLPVPRQLPPGIRDFVGRALDLDALDALVPGDAAQDAVAETSGAVTLCVIVGSAGVGKTTLALQWGHRMRDRFPDGALYANLRGFGPGHPAVPGDVLDAFLRALNVPPGRIPSDQEARTALYRSLLDGRRVLVVLDNANSAEQVRPLLPAGPGSLALVTSRSTLTGLVVGNGAARVSVDLLAQQDAVALLRGIVGTARAQAEPEALARIALACARLPLALRIAAQRAATRPHLRLSEVVAELAGHRTRLDALSATDDESTAVRAVFTWSYRALPPAQALVFRRLGLHPGVEIDIHAAAALAGSGPGQIRVALEALAEVHLVEPVARDRYLAHDLLRAYARECVEQEEAPDERAAAAQRLLGFYLHTVDAADRRLTPARWRLDPSAVPLPAHPLAFDTDEQARTWFVAECANLIAAAHSAADAALYTLAWQLPAACNGLFDNRGHLPDWLSTLQRALAATQALGEGRGETYTRVNLSHVLMRLRRFDEAAEQARCAVAVAQRTADLPGQAHALGYRGWSHHYAGDFAKAAECHVSSRQLFLQLGDTWAATVALTDLADAYRALGRLDDALDGHNRALEIFRELGDQHREGWTLWQLGNDHQAADRFDAALENHRRALETARTHIGNRQLEARALDEIGADLHPRDRAGARAHWQAALALYKQLGDPAADDVCARLNAA